MFNISMLKRVFSPNFELHDIKQTGEYELTTRWTMTMQFNPTKGTPLTNVWDPKLVFTGISIMGVNPETGAGIPTCLGINRENGAVKIQSIFPERAPQIRAAIYLIRGSFCLRKVF
jgi:hypothetical protein